MPHSLSAGAFGAGGKINAPALVAAPSGVITVTFPDDPFPTSAVICVGESTV